MLIISDGEKSKTGTENMINTSVTQLNARK